MSRLMMTQTKQKGQDGRRVTSPDDKLRRNADQRSRTSKSVSAIYPTHTKCHPMEDSEVSPRDLSRLRVGMMMHGAWDVGGLWLVKWVVLLAAVVPCSAWYLPGSAPRSFGKGDSVPVQVNTLQPMSGATPVHGLVSYDYYDDRLGFCKPDTGILPQSGSLGSILLGDRIYNSPLEIHMLQDEQCSLLCKQTVNEKQAAFINERINERYGINWMVDGLPVADAGLTGSDGTVRANSVGFALGSTYDANLNRLATPALYNHYRLNVSYHERSPNEYRVVGVNVIPMSMESLPNGLQGSVSCENAQPMFLSNSSQTPVAYTYDVVWTPSNTPWATRWDAYLHVVDPRIHWYSLLNSIAIVALLCVMVGLIMARAVRRDIYRYNAIDLTEDIQEDYGWKLVHGEVFRPPSSPMLLSVMAGTGAQLLAIAVVTLFFALLGFLSPSNRGSLATIMIITWTLFGIVSGWVSAKVYASFDGEKWRRNMLLTATLFPALVFGTMNLLNVLLVYDHSAGAVPFGTLLTLVVLWSLINAPLSFLGSYLGLKSGAISHPVRVNQIPRQIPPSPWYLRLWPSAILTGIMPFGAAWLELFFIITSLFGNRVYYAFGFLTLTFVVTTATTATVSILACYFHLCAEEYRWQWRAFITGGSSAFWLFAYGLFYCFTRLNLPDFSSKVLFLGYLSMLSLLDFLLFGFVGFIACYVCVKTIYSQIRVD